MASSSRLVLYLQSNKPINMTVADSSDDSLIQKVTEFVRGYMSHYDSSHDFSHIQRVVGLAQHLAAASPASPPLDHQDQDLGAPVLP